jgi:hypothetical protein
MDPSILGPGEEYLRDRHSFLRFPGTDSVEINNLMKQVSSQVFVIRSRIKGGTNNLAPPLAPPIFGKQENGEGAEWVLGEWIMFTGL